MASIENRSRIQVTVKNRDDLTKQFAHSADKAIQVYVQKLRAEGLKPRLASLNDHYICWFVPDIRNIVWKRSATVAASPSWTNRCSRSDVRDR